MKIFKANLQVLLRITALIAGLSLFAGGAAANVTVIASDVPEIKPKTELSDDTRISIGRGQSVTLLLPSAKTKTVLGPFNGEVRKLYSNPGFISRIYRLIVDRWRTGNVDDSQGTALRFLPPLYEGGWKPIRLRDSIGEATAIYCYEAGTFPQIVRTAERKSNRLVITDAVSGTERASVDWPEGSNTISWPSAMPLADGGRYTLSNSDVVNSIVLKKVPSGSFSGDNVVNVLGEADCTPQLAVWLKETSGVK